MARESGGNKGETESEKDRVQCTVAGLLGEC